jgi:type III restriction enzyme
VRHAGVYPDFIFAVNRDGTRSRVVLETKGDQLDKLDTAYKRDLLDFLTANFRCDEAIPAG